jgi:ADP-ribose pyrophosphatase YjhB (NUDIX family)
MTESPFQMPSKHMGAAAVILDSGGRVLLVKHSYGNLQWGPPGGLSESGESAAETVVREVREETGLEVAVERLTGVYFEPAVDLHHFVFKCRLVLSAEPRPVPPEITQCGYFALDNLPRPIHDFTVRRISDALDGAAPSIEVIGPRKWL